MKVAICQRHKCIEAIQAHRMEAISLMVAGISHDINNLLTGIWAHTGVIQRLARDKEIKERSVHIAQLCARITDMLKKVILLTKDGHHLKLQALNLNQEVEKNLQMLKGMILPSIKLKSYLYPYLPPIYADPTAVTEIITNLVLNAAHVLNSGGVIKIKTSVTTVTESECMEHANAYPGKFVTLTVADNGPGIAPEDLPRVFDPCFSTKNSHGLGLAIVYMLMNAHAGWVHVESKLERGTQFLLYFPVKPAAEC
ncbi:MAG: ATP-binding protein [Candidatus Desulfofervidaceae bacterium]|nr:ATP-binding protein [Candidatus Desulfofervidaceae bacterium]